LPRAATLTGPIRFLAAARKTFHSRRDEAIVLLLLDTGPRASESCRRRNAGHVRPNDYSSW
jgi:hypothetical protein